MKPTSSPDQNIQSESPASADYAAPPVPEPEGGSMHTLRMVDLMDVEDIQRLQDTFAAATSTMALIVDPDGAPITKPSNMRRLCCEGEEAHAAICTKRTAGHKAFLAHAPLQSFCPNLTFVDQSAPIIMDGHYLGNLVIGQYFSRRISTAETQSMAEDCRMCPDDIRARYAEFPDVENEEFSRSAKLLPLFVQYFTDACRKNLAARKAEEERQRTIDILSTLLNSGDVLLGVVDPETYSFDFVSAAMKEAFDIEPGKKCYEAFYGVNSPCDDCTRQKTTLAPGESVAKNVDVRELDNPATGKSYQITDRKFIWYTGKPMHLLTAVDVTERKALIRSEIANAERRSFFSRMSHELRTPLNGVLGMTQLALNANPEPRQSEYLQKIASSATVLLGIINDALDFSKIEAGRLELAHTPFSLRRDVLDPIKNMFLPEIGRKDLDFSVTASENVPDVFNGDSLRLSQIFINLIGNAIKFTSRGGIHVTIVVDDPCESLSQDAVRLKCEVRDSGIGMNKEQMDRLFVPFVQAETSTAQKFGGTGLGLSISRALAVKMGGDILVKSREGEGSTFYFEVVLEKARERRVRKDLRDQFARLELKSCRILVVEDNAINQEIAVELLRTFGADVDVVEDGEPAVTAVAEGDYDLVFMDMLMPKMNGIEATRLIRSLENDKAKTPIVAMTANAMLEDQQECKECGMNDHIAKPVSMQNLTRVLRSWLPQRCIKN